MEREGGVEEGRVGKLEPRPRQGCGHHMTRLEQAYNDRYLASYYALLVIANTYEICGDSNP